MNRKLKIVLNFILIPLFIYAIYIIIQIPQPYGIIALGALLLSLIFNLIKKNIVSLPIYSIGIIGALFTLYSAFTFKKFTDNTRSKFDIPTEVIFEKSDFQTALSKAQSLNKPLFVDFYTAWCAPCLNFTQNVLTDKEVGKYMNQAFINLKYDAELDEGIKLSKKYEVKGYPTLLIIDNSGNKLEKIGGTWLAKKEDMIAIAKKYMEQ